MMMDRHDQPFFLASLRLLFPLRGYSDEEYRTRHHVEEKEQVRHKFGTPEDGTSLAPPKYGLVFIGEIVYSSSDLLLTHVRCNSHYEYLYAFGSSN